MTKIDEANWISVLFHCQDHYATSLTHLNRRIGSRRVRLQLDDANQRWSELYNQLLELAN